MVLPSANHGKSTRSLEVFGREIRIKGRLIRIAFVDGEGYQFLEDPEAAVKVLRGTKTRIDLFTFIQKLSDTTPKFSYPMELDNIAALPITTYDDWLKSRIDFRVRNKIKKAAKSGVVAREVPFDDNFIQGISSVYNESPIRQGKRFWHHGTDVEYARRVNGTFPSQSIYIGAYFEGNLIGFVKLVTNEDRSQAGLMQIVSMIQSRDKAPTNALIAQAVRSCAERGISYLWYANMDYGKKQGDSLAEFKKHNGFEKIEIPRFYVPLTRWGHIALQSRLHQGLAQWIPEPIVAQFRRIRSLWYAKWHHRSKAIKTLV